MRLIEKIISGENINVPYCPKDHASFKFAPVVSCDVERSFSAFKDLLTNKRTNLTEENIMYHLVISCNMK